jgi:hypothetical protein
VNGHAVTLLDANDAVLDSAAFVQLDDGAGLAGALHAANGLTLNFGGNITGFGTVNTPNTPTQPLINNGHITGSGAQPVTLTGYIKGVGTLDNVLITGTGAPGFSPATVYFGSVIYGGNLEIELAGENAGQFDVIHHSGTATLGGNLTVSLLNGFTPTAGDTFEIMTAAEGVAGKFATATLPALTGANWQLDYSTSALLLRAVLVGDYNHNGTVDAADYVVWRNSLNQSGPALAADGNRDGHITPLDFNVWKMHLGESTPGGAAGGQVAANAPEPGTLLLATVLAGVALACRPSIAIQRARRN